ncbi:MAG: GNAT family N-acetyltransferase [Acidimicrobiia bacterium]|nr:GNAT family N-acetyltransferase [Acidimicrobiia bacterium]
MKVRPLDGQDFHSAAARIDDWFEDAGYEAIHPVFFHHFGGYAVEDDDGALAGFLIGFRSLRNGDIAYIHVIAIDPARRRQGIGTELYDRFEKQARVWNCYTIEAVAEPANTRAIAFHRQRGFKDRLVEGWGGPGIDRVVLQKSIQPEFRA